PRNLELYLRTLSSDGFFMAGPLSVSCRLLTARSKTGQKNSRPDRCQRHLHDGLHMTVGCTSVLQDADPVDRVGEALRDRAGVKPGRDLPSLLPLLQSGR